MQALEEVRQEAGDCSPTKSHKAVKLKDGRVDLFDKLTGYNRIGICSRKWYQPSCLDFASMVA